MQATSETAVWAILHRDAGLLSGLSSSWVLPVRLLRFSAVALKPLAPPPGRGQLTSRDPRDRHFILFTFNLYFPT